MQDKPKKSQYQQQFETSLNEKKNKDHNKRTISQDKPKSLKIIRIQETSSQISEDKNEFIIIPDDSEVSPHEDDPVGQQQSQQFINKSHKIKITKQCQSILNQKYEVIDEKQNETSQSIKIQEEQQFEDSPLKVSQQYKQTSLNNDQTVTLQVKQKICSDTTSLQNVNKKEIESIHQVDVPQQQQKKIEGIKKIPNPVQQNSSKFEQDLIHILKEQQEKNQEQKQFTPSISSFTQLSLKQANQQQSTEKQHQNKIQIKEQQLKESKNLEKQKIKQFQREKQLILQMNAVTIEDSQEEVASKKLKEFNFKNNLQIQNQIGQSKLDFSQLDTFKKYQFVEGSLLKHSRRHFIVTIENSDPGRILTWFMRKFHFSLRGIIIFTYKFQYNILILQLLDTFQIKQSNIKREYGQCQLLSNIVDAETIRNLNEFCTLQIFMINDYHFILDSEFKIPLNQYEESSISGKYFEFIYYQVENRQILLNQILKISKWSQKSLSISNDHTMIFQAQKKIIIYFMRKKSDPTIILYLLKRIHKHLQITVLDDNVNNSKLDEILRIYHQQYINIKSLIIPKQLSNIDQRLQLKQNKLRDIYENFQSREIYDN